MGIMRRFAIGLLGATVVTFVGCGGPPRPPKLPEEESIHAGEEKTKPVQEEDPIDATDPAQNATRPGAPSVSGQPGQRPQPLLPAGSEDSEKAVPTTKSGKPGKKSEKITAEDCTRMIDHYLEVVVTSDSRFADLGPEAGNMVRQVAAQDPTYQKAQKDCVTDVTRPKYDCAMAARTPTRWQACVK